MKLHAADNREFHVPGLQDLDQVVLNPQNRDLLQEAMQHSGGDAATRNRMQAEAAELLALTQITPAGRLVVKHLDLREHLRAALSLQVPVACQPKRNNELVVSDRALVGFSYPNEGFTRPLPGYAFFQILLPCDVWLPQVKQPEQSLCIAPLVPAGTRTAMLLLQLYGALSMQSIQLDVRDAAGMFSPSVARWWQDNLDRVPLTKVAFLEPNTQQSNSPVEGQTPVFASHSEFGPAIDRAGVLPPR